MSITRSFTAPFLLTALLGICTVALAQPIPEAQRKYSRFSEPDVKTGENVELETGISTRVEIPGIVITPCQAQVELAYYQRNTLARVDVVVTHEHCTAVNGGFNILVSVRDGDDDLTRYTYPETFALRGGDRTEFRREYPIGENVTLSRVRSANVTCECHPEPAEQ